MFFVSEVFISLLTATLKPIGHISVNCIFNTVNRKMNSKNNFSLGWRKGHTLCKSLTLYYFNQDYCLASYTTVNFINKFTSNTNERLEFTLRVYDVSADILHYITGHYNHLNRIIDSLLNQP